MNTATEIENLAQYLNNAPVYTITMVYSYTQDGKTVNRTQIGDLSIPDPHGKGNTRGYENSIPVVNQRVNVLKSYIGTRTRSIYTTTYMHPTAEHHGCPCDTYEWTIYLDNHRMVARSRRDITPEQAVRDLVKIVPDYLQTIADYYIIAIKEYIALRHSEGATPEAIAEIENVLRTLTHGGI